MRILLGAFNAGHDIATHGRCSSTCRMMCCSSDDHLPISDVIAEVTVTAAIDLSNARRADAEDVDIVEMCSRFLLDRIC